MKHKKVSGGLLASALALTLIGCSSTADPETTPDATGTTTDAGGGGGA